MLDLASCEITQKRLTLHAMSLSRGERAGRSAGGDRGQATPNRRGPRTSCRREIELHVTDAWRASALRLRDGEQMSALGHPASMPARRRRDRNRRLPIAVASAAGQGSSSPAARRSAYALAFRYCLPPREDDARERHRQTGKGRPATSSTGWRARCEPSPPADQVHSSLGFENSSNHGPRDHQR